MVNHFWPFRSEIAQNNDHGNDNQIPNNNQSPNDHFITPRDMLQRSQSINNFTQGIKKPYSQIFFLYAQVLKFIIYNFTCEMQEGIVRIIMLVVELSHWCLLTSLETIRHLS